MKKQFIQLFGLALLLSSCSGKTYQALIWKEKPVAIDGHQDDWNEFLRYYDKSSKLFYELDNDDQNLYFAVSTRDESSQQKIMQKGLTLGIDLKAGKDFPIQVTFPYAEVRQKGDQQNESGSTKEKPDFKVDQGSDQASSKPSGEKGSDSKGPGRPGGKPGANQKIYVKGFLPQVADSVLDVHNPYGIAFSMELKDSTLFVEGRIPLSAFYKDAITAADTLKPVNFQILLSALEKPGSQSGGGQGDRPDGPPSGGMSGGFGGGPGGGGPGGGPGGMPPGGGGMGRSGGGPGGMGGSQKSSGNESQKSLDYAKKEISMKMRFSLEE
ncbi:hypothetical protein [Mangrovibacterium diazotrophicum]|uniref:Lipoprotein n=1 Tax=Mangrovibacterium diazotrophicum TaxID=1261403 RepID=A0A419W8U4_9BACT|nr:hypothetical protein [Mangrovibacterium diazotrophicum]RKD91897.1 hypothetical protein BC643_2266 [Mangrovibacterium diazotrophicum]